MNSNYMKNLIISVATALLIAGCASMGGSDSGVNILTSGNHSNIKDPQYSDIHNQADFDALWQKAFAKQSGAPDKPVVDFSKDMVLAIFIGDQSTGGYIIRIKNVDTSGATIDVTVLVTSPGQNCRHPRSASDAFMIATMPASTKTVNFDPKYEQAPACGA